MLKVFLSKALQKAEYSNLAPERMQNWTATNTDKNHQSFDGNGKCAKMKTIRQEFRKSQFNFKHDKPHDFAIWSVSISLSFPGD